MMLVGIASALLVGVPTILIGGPTTVSAVTPNLPVFPNNIGVFPNRDFVNFEGYADHDGQQALVEVTRPGAGVVGSAIGTVDVNPTGVIFEVNHPGGICWGAGTGLLVTPDVQAGDVVSIKIPANPATGAAAVNDATTVPDAFANDAVQNGVIVVVTGHIGPLVNRANIEQRIIEPALVDTVIGKRDIRAIPGPMTPAAKGGYSSSLEFDLDGANTFRATYDFTLSGAEALDNATIAANAGLGERAMVWELADAAGNRQGMSISENGELGGPGMGGCPNGPLQSGPPGPTNAVAAPVPNDPTAINVNWTSAVTTPGTPAILGYEVTAVAQTINATGEQVQIGRRINNPGANHTTITGLDALETYNIELVSVSSVGKTFPVIHAIPAADVTPPTVSASPNGGSFPLAQQVTLTANEVGSQIFYTTDLSDPTTSLSAIHYTGPIAVSTNTTLMFAAFDPSNNVSIVVTEVYTITNDPTPAATSFTTSSVGLNQVTLNWAAADPVLPATSILNYKVDVFASASATTPIRTVNLGNVLTTTITGLTGDTPYWFEVSAKNNVNPAFGPASARLGPLTPQGLVVANAGPDQTGVVRGTVVNLSGAGSTAGATYSWTQMINGTSSPMPAGINKVTLVNPTTINPSFTLPLYKFPMANIALTFRLTVTTANGVRTDDVVVTPASDVVTITSAKWKPGDLRVVGTTTTVGAIVTIRSASGVVYGVAAVTAAAPPAVGGVYDFRLRVNVPTTNPLTVYVDSNRGGTAGPFTVSG
jgi:Chitobiase/beta-hexosaminidase C-terminal domain